jgi:hypothetical protein
VENNSAVECVPAPRSAPVPFDRPVEEWTTDDVRLFLVAVRWGFGEIRARGAGNKYPQPPLQAKLSMYEPLFVAGQITGAKLKALNGEVKMVSGERGGGLFAGFT